MATIINRDTLIQKIGRAKKCVRVLGAVAFDLPYTDLRDGFLKKISDDVKYKDFKLEIIIESDSLLNYESLISSNRFVSGENIPVESGELKNTALEPIMNLRNHLKSHGCKHLEPEVDAKDGLKQKLFIRTYYLTPKIPAIQIDDEYYISYALTKFKHLERFEKITKDHVWANEFFRYFKAFFDDENGAKKYATEFTDKRNRLEVIEMYNEARIPLGQLPRDSFMDTTRMKVVVWGLIFSRNGKILIHKRADNAKDNRDMWDKSVGGHVDIEKDMDTVKASARELIEELYSHEQEGQGGHNSNEMFDIRPSYLIFLGEWRPEFRYDKLYEEIEYHEDQNYYFRMDYDYSRQPRNSNRTLPDNGGVRLVRAFADLYVCVASTDFETKVNSEKLDDEKKLQNSQYLLLYPYQIKELSLTGECLLNEEDTEMMNKKILEHKDAMSKKPELGDLPYSMDGNTLVYDKKKGFRITPDLANIIHSELWEEKVSAFSSTLTNRWARRNK